MTTPYSAGLIKRFSSPYRKPPSRLLNLLADQPYSAATPPLPCIRAKWGEVEPHRISKPDKIAI